MKVISGGQIGVDIAALRAAKRAGIETGGFVPLGFKTKDGPKPEWAAEFGLHETGVSLYPYRTARNVQTADATIRIAVNFNSAGERCTLRAIKTDKKPYLDINWSDPQSPREVASWLRERRWLRGGWNEIEVLNVAGNALVHIEGSVEFYLYQIFKLWKEGDAVETSVNNSKAEPITGPGQDQKAQGA